MLLVMKATVTLTSRGLISLPARMRAELGLKADDVLFVETTPDGILLRPAAMFPVEVYTPERIEEFDAEEARLEAVLPTKRKARR